MHLRHPKTKEVEGFFIKAEPSKAASILRALPEKSRLQILNDKEGGVPMISRLIDKAPPLSIQQALDMGANVFERDSKGLLPIEHADLRTDKYGIDIEKRVRKKMFEEAAKPGTEEIRASIVREMAQFGNNLLNDHGVSLLQLSVMRSRAAAEEFLHRAKGSARMQDLKGYRSKLITDIIYARWPDLKPKNEVSGRVQARSA